MLQEFLNNNLLPITDESHFEKLKKASDDLAKKIAKNKENILSYTLLAIDPDVPLDNPIIEEVKELITTKYWNTFSNNSKDTPVTFIRAVMLEALEIVSKETKEACLIWLTARNIQKHFKLIDKEKVLITNFLLSLGKEIEDKAAESWSLPSDSKLQKSSVEIKELTGITIDLATLQKRLTHASGPTDEAGTVPIQDPTTVWPNSGASWVHQFVPKVAKSITDIINKALLEQGKVLVANQTQILDTVNKLLIQTQSEILERNKLLQMRTQLLWWKESCYSNSLNQSYRGQPNGLLQILLANDYSSFVPVIYPTSADYFLKETHRILVEEENKKVKISEILKQIELSSSNLKIIFPEPKIESGRISLLSYIKGFIWNKYTTKQFRSLVGFSDTSEIALSEFVLWLFHDFQSFKISNSK